MTIAAIYARYSSDSQREESIEIQVEACTHLIESHGWELGEVYTDYALSGTNDKRPAFQRCIVDGEARLFDVLVIYKNDRFARNVVDSKQYKKRLRDAGVTIWSVREGESKDTPDSFLHETMDEAFAEYYSRNLSVLIRQGNQKNAEQCKASGTRIFGYDVDESDHFVINEEQASYVREMFERKHNGQTTNEIVRWMEAEGLRTSRGNPFSRQTVGKMLRNPAYIGTYRYAGHIVEDGMPAIIDKGLFHMVNDKLETAQANKRVHEGYEYFLTGTTFCLHDGTGLVGQSGVGKLGKKYPYYVCQKCGLRVPAGKLENAVMETIREVLLSDGSVESMARSLEEYVQDELASSKWQLLKDEQKEIIRERDRLVKSIAAGVDPTALADQINRAQSLIENLDARIAREKFYLDRMSKPEDLEAFVRKAIEQSKINDDIADDLFKEVIDLVYVEKDTAYLLFSIGDVESNVSPEDIEALKNANPSVDGVRIRQLWWTSVDTMRTLYSNGQSFLIILHID